MPTIRDLVNALRLRDGVDAAVVLGRDGLLIDGDGAPGLDPEGIAALVPSVVSAADELGRHAVRGALTTAILEYAEGVAVVSALTADAVLLVLTRAEADVGRLLFEIRRNRANIAALV